MDKVVRITKRPMFWFGIIRAQYHVGHRWALEFVNGALAIVTTDGTIREYFSEQEDFEYAEND